MRFLMIGCLLAVFATRGMAWDADGHEIVATIAFDQLNPKAKAEALALAKQVTGPHGNNYDPITAACWMDDLREREGSFPCQGFFFPWHYISLGLEPGDPRPLTEPGQDNETSGNVITALKRVMVVLQGGTDPYVKNKAMAYAMVCHLVGDIHQPLHAGTRYHREADGQWKNDAGGNKVEVVNGPANEAKFNLHFFWDDAWRASFDPASGRIVLDARYADMHHHSAALVHGLAEEMEAADKPAASVSLATDFSAWADESNRVAREVVYPRLTYTENHREARISAEYVALANPLTRRRIVLAGYRLAALLNATLGAATPGPVLPSYPSGPPSAPPFDTLNAPSAKK